MSKAKLFCVINYKGGTGKTCTIVNIAHGISKKGLKVLIIDTDPQGSTSYHFGINPKKTHYFGHPLPLNITPFDSAKKNTFTVGLFPGSRKSEINHHLPAMLAIKNQTKQSNIEFKLFCETPKLIPQIKAILLHNNCSEVPVYANLDEQLDFAITAPGTNTLKLALHKIPMIIIGYLNIWV